MKQTSKHLRRDPKRRTRRINRLLKACRAYRGLEASK